MGMLELFIIGTFASFALTYSVAVDKDLEGPFYLYDWIRATLQKPWVPKLVRENYDCPYCASFYAALLVAVVIQFLLPFVSVVHSLAMLFLFTYAMHGVIVFWFRYIRMMYTVGAREF